MKKENRIIKDYICKGNKNKVDILNSFETFQIYEMRRRNDNQDVADRGVLKVKALNGCKLSDLAEEVKDYLKRMKVFRFAQVEFYDKKVGSVRIDIYPNMTTEVVLRAYQIALNSASELYALKQACGIDF